MTSDDEPCARALAPVALVAAAPAIAAAPSPDLARLKAHLLGGADDDRQFHADRRARAGLDRDACR